MILTLLILPLLGSIISGLLGRLIGYKSSKYITTLCILISLIITIILYKNIILKNEIYKLNLGEYIKIDNIKIEWSFIIDELSISLLLPICLISSLVHIYAINYMSHDPYQQRFFSILSLFTGFMIILVTGSNYLILFIGWELIAVSSYLLISHWYTIINAIKSGINSLLINKIGDTLLTIGLLLITITFGSLNFSTIFSLSQYINTDIISLIMFCLLIGAIGKSAQLGLHIWLLYSMAGPTPVSALLHAACLVCAGIYLLLRSSYLLEYSPIILLLILWIGGLTTLIAGLIAIVSNDLKKIIALSTMSQLGLMILAIGLSNYNASIYHLFTHAIFKALLFMSAGSIIHSISIQSQDIRTFGSLLNYTPITYICFLIGSFSLMAIPGLSGFYSKDIIIESIYGIYSFSGFIIYWFALISASLTSIYSFRLIYLVFFNIPNNNKFSFFIINENNFFLLSPIIILAFFSIFIGYFTKDIYLGFGSSFHSLFIHPNHLSIIDTEFSLPFFLKFLPLFFTFFFISFLFLLYEFSFSFNFKFLSFPFNNIYYSFFSFKFFSLYLFFNSKFMFDFLFNNHFLRFFLFFGYYLNLFLDKGFLYLFGPIGFFKSFNFLSYKIISLSSNHFSFIHNNFHLFSDYSHIKHFNLYFLFFFFNLSLFFFFFSFFNQFISLFFIFIISIPFII